MAIATTPANVLNALIEEARRRARRRRRFIAILAFVVAGATAGASAGLSGRGPLAGLQARGGGGTRPIVVVTNWNEKQTFANNDGVVRLYVRKLEFDRTSWKAWVGITNSSRVPVALLAHERLYHDIALPLTYVAYPGVWWQTYHKKGGSWFPGSGWTENHIGRAASIKPGYPEKLAPKKSWFGVFSGTTTKLPKDRLLRIGFGVACICPENWQHRTPLSTDHTFKLPRR